MSPTKFSHNPKAILSKSYAHIARYKALLLLVVLCVGIGVAFIYSNSAQPDVDTATQTQRLNLSKHAFWDDPAYDEEDMNDFFLMVCGKRQSETYDRLMTIFSDETSVKQIDSLLHIINRMDDFPYKAFVQVLAYERTLLKSTLDELTPDFIHNCVDNIYVAASGSYTCPQAMFFSCWGRAMDAYARQHQTDSVLVEASRMLTVCRQNNIPFGVIEAYVALGTCLETVKDYRGAIQQYEVAIAHYEKFYDEKFGKEWRSDFENYEETNMAYSNMKVNNDICCLLSDDTLSIARDTAFLHDLLQSEAITYDEDSYSRICFLLADYNDQRGDGVRYAYYMKRLADYFDEHDINIESKDNDNKESLCYYYRGLVRHHLRHHQPDKVIRYINIMPEAFSDSTTSYMPDALMQQGKYAEASRRYKSIVDYCFQQLNGRNRNTLSSLSSGIGEEAHQMQMMQAQLHNQQTRIMYNTILIFVFTIMIVGLAYFLYRQHRLNRELSQAVEAEERARHVKDIFLKNMTHEFHTPLNAIYGFSQILADPSFPVDEESTREMATEMVKSSEHITRLIDNIVEVTDKLADLDYLEEVESILKQNNIEQSDIEQSNIV